MDGSITISLCNFVGEVIKKFKQVPKTEENDANSFFTKKNDVVLYCHVKNITNQKFLET
jgi:hypothetical protein